LPTSANNIGTPLGYLDLSEKPFRVRNIKGLNTFRGAFKTETLLRAKTAKNTNCYFT